MRARKEGETARVLAVATTWADVQHQAQRCKHLQDPAARMLAGRLWFQMCREALSAGPGPQQQDQNSKGTRYVPGSQALP